MSEDNGTMFSSLSGISFENVQALARIAGEHAMDEAIERSRRTRGRANAARKRNAESYKRRMSNLGV